MGTLGMFHTGDDIHYRNKIKIRTTDILWNENFVKDVEINDAKVLYLNFAFNKQLIGNS